MNIQQLDAKHLALACEVAQSSKDPSTKVGAVLVRPDGSVASVAYNRFPIDHPDEDEHYADREHKYQHIWHAEEWALNFFNSPANGFTLYTSFPVCPACLEKAHQYGVTRVVFPPLPTQGKGQAWIEEWQARVQISLAKAELYGIRVSIVHV